MKNMWMLLLLLLASSLPLSGCGRDRTPDPDGSAQVEEDRREDDAQTPDASGSGWDIFSGHDGEDRETDNEPDAQEPSTALENGKVQKSPTAQESRSARQQSGGDSLLPGATYEEMLRNARVHDRDGDLSDGENAVTPGTVLP